MTNEQIVFIVLALIAIGSALGVVMFKSPVRSVVSLVITCFTLALLYFNLGAQMLGISQIMVYAGAIMVLFLFVVMMLKLGSYEPAKEKADLRVVPAIGIAVGLCVVVIAKVFLPISSFMTTTKAPDNFGTPQSIGWALPTTYVWPFMVASVLLLIGVVGSIMLAKKRF